ncbi:MAG: hypothetical protein MJZ18_04245 [Bacteroidales bacterium]|nr:hypothetical protein [Bacteroidales bacterium]
MKLFKLITSLAVFLSLLIPLSFISCEDIENNEEPLSLVGLWKFYYIYDITNAENEYEIVNDNDSYMYYQFNADNSYTSCIVKYVEDSEPIISVASGIWTHKHKSLDITLSPSNSDGVMYKVKLISVGSPKGTVVCEGKTETKIYEFRATPISPAKESWITDVVDEAKSFVEIPREVMYNSRLFTNIMGVNNSYWMLSKDWELDCYIFTGRVWKDQTDNKDNGKKIVQHCHGKIVVYEYENSCDSVDLIIDDYCVPVESISTKSVMRSYLLPGCHRYPIYYGSKEAIINRSKDGLPNLGVWYISDPVNIKDFHIVPWTFDFSEYKSE